MGIQHLNHYLRQYCPNEIKQMTLWELRKKKIVIDTSIYMYRFEGEGGLIDGMYQMITLMLYYGIIPIFVFDGVSPPEKKELIKQRKEKKYIAEKKYNNAKERLGECSTDEISYITTEMNELRKQFIRLRSSDIENVKQLMKLCGVTYYEAEGEADQLCAKLVIKHKAYACMSEDMDMFVYGCPRVLRYLSLINNTVIMYDLKAILHKLKLSMDEFKEICVLSGTDYNLNNTQESNLYKTLKWFEKYKKNCTDNKRDFYKWLEANTNYIKDYCQLISTLIMFDLKDMNIKKYDKQQIVNGPINNKELQRFLYDYDFIFV